MGPGIIAPLMMMDIPGYPFLVAALFYGFSLSAASCVRTQSTGGIEKGESVLSGIAE